MNELTDLNSVAIKTLKLIISLDKEVIEQGKELIEQVKQEFTDARQKQNLLQLIETILVYKLPKINRQEIEKMFSLNDLRETKVYQEALEEGMEKGMEKGMEEAKIQSIPRLLALGLSLEQIAQALDLSLEKVQEITQN